MTMESSNLDVEPDNVLDIFNQFKMASKDHLNATSDLLRLDCLEKLVDQLVEQNQILIETVNDLWLVTRDRSQQLESRLVLSAKQTEESVLQLDNCGTALQNLVNECVSRYRLSEIIAALDANLTLYQSENASLRERNDNLRHDLNNLLRIVKNDKRTQAVVQSLTFFDSLNSEDIFGNFEKIISTSHTVEQSKPAEGECQPQQLEDKVCQTEVLTNAAKDVQSISKSIHKTDPNDIAAEKDMLIEQLQNHLSALVRTAEMKDDVIKNLENKLNEKRNESRCSAERCNSVEAELLSFRTEAKEMKAQIEAMTRQKQDMMIRLDEECEEKLMLKNEASKLRKEIDAKIKDNQLQAITIQHLRDAIATQVKALMDNRSQQKVAGSESAQRESRTMSNCQDI